MSTLKSTCFHLYVNNHCNSQEVDSYALVKIVPMKYWCHFWKYIRYTLQLCINGENRTRKNGKIRARKKNTCFRYRELQSVWYLNVRRIDSISAIYRRLLVFKYGQFWNWRTSRGYSSSKSRETVLWHVAPFIVPYSYFCAFSTTKYILAG